ncbi:MAG: hypothetical protein J7M25_08425 [Deltaproteobacteria bacterium]|nr:hypothetical protein [Deltaproteobacteria bacterium]
MNSTDEISSTNEKQGRRIGSHTPHDAGHVVGWTVVAVVILGIAAPAWAQNFKIIEQNLNNQRQGYQVIRVWGTHYEMGYAQGFALAADIVAAVHEVKNQVGVYYGATRSAIYDTWWSDVMDQEIDGMVDGIKDRIADAPVDATDIKVINTVGDWGYYGGCRSHSCWGHFLQPPIKTITTRRLDFPVVFAATNHHVMMAWSPSDGSTKWVNLAFPGYITVVTGVNEYGEVVSLHDFQTDFQPASGGVLRCMASRHVLTAMADIPMKQHLAWAADWLSNQQFTTGSFINYYAPEGHGGVFTCSTGGSCDAPRTPQADFFAGDVIITTNSQTDGHSVPAGGEFMGDYYQQGGVKTMESAYDLMGHSGLHLMTVGYRGQEDMTIWAEGRLPDGVTPRIEMEWSKLFSDNPEPDGDAGPHDGGSLDGGLDDASNNADSSVSVDATNVQNPSSNGCGCATIPPAGHGATWPLIALFLGLAMFWRKRRTGNQVG